MKMVRIPSSIVANCYAARFLSAGLRKQFAVAGGSAGLSAMRFSAKLSILDEPQFPYKFN
jgi:hypothetical protein